MRRVVSQYLFLISFVSVFSIATAIAQPTLIASPEKWYCAGSPDVAIGVEDTETGVVYILQIWDGNSWVDLESITGNEDEDVIDFSRLFFEQGEYQLIEYGYAIPLYSITIEEKPVPNATITASATPHDICRGETIRLSAQAVSGGQYHWGHGGLSGQYIDVSPLNHMTYTLRVTDAFSCSATGSIAITVNDLPVSYALGVEGQPTASTYCTPVIPRLNGTQVGIEYTLLRDGIVVPGEIYPGYGGALSFGKQTTAGVYSVMAKNTSTFCSSMMSGSINAMSTPFEFSLTPDGAGPFCAGIELGISGSETNVSYTLLRTAEGVQTIAAGPIPGNGNAITFGQSIYGEYQVLAKNIHNNCDIFFSDTREVEQPPAAISIPPPYKRCAGEDIILYEVEGGVDYYLHFTPFDKAEKSMIVGPLTGVDGQQVNFGPQTAPGVYTIRARNSSDCETIMDGSISVFPKPEVYLLKPGILQICGPEIIRLGNSQNGVQYTLLRDGALVSTMAGSGNELNFGLQSAPGIYTIIGKYDHGNGLICQQDMAGSLEILSVPQKYTLRPLQSSCAPVEFRLENTQQDVDYFLYNENQNGIIASFTGTGNAMSFSPPVTQSGIYYVMARGTNLCESKMTGVREVFSPPAIFSLTPDGTICDDEDAVIGLNGSESGVSYVLHRENIPFGDPMAGTGAPISFDVNVPPGTYSIVAENMNRCKQTMEGEAIVVQPPAPYQVLVNGQIAGEHTFCPGKTIGLSGSDTGITYVLELPDGSTVMVSGNGSAIDFPDTYNPRGAYTIYAESDHCRSAMTGSVVINEPIRYPTVIVGQNHYCAGDQDAITIRLQGSETGVNYRLYKDDMTAVFATKAGTGGALEWTGVALHGPGSYIVRAHYPSDPGCMINMESPVQVVESTNQITIGQVAPLCPGETIQLEATAGTGTYTWYDHHGNEIGYDAVLEVTQMAQTTYQVTHINQYGCEAHDQITVNMHALPSVSLVTDQAPTAFCAGGSVDITAAATGNPAFQYKWFRDGSELSFTTSTLMVDESGSFHVEVTDANSCKQTSSPLVVTVHDAPDVAISADGPTSICAGDHIMIQANSQSNITQYRWQLNGNYIAGKTAPSLQVTEQGMIRLEVKNNHGCSAVSNEVEVTVHALPLADAGPDESICLGDPIILTAISDNNDVSFFWDHGRANGQEFIPANAGLRKYKVRVRDNQTLCEATDIVTVTVKPSPNISAGDDEYICFGDEVILRGRGQGVTFEWQPEQLNIQDGVPFGPLSSANYTVIGTDKTTGCRASDQVDVIVNPLPVVLASKSAPFLCRGSDITLTATGGALYIWSDNLGDGPSVVVSPEKTQTYYVTVTDNNGCMADDSVTVPVYPFINAGDDQYVCDGETVVLSATGGINYNWSHGVINNQAFTPSQTQTYLVRTIDQYGCSGTDEVTVFVNQLPNASAAADKMAVCAGEPVTLYGEGGVHYKWSHGVEQGIPFLPAASDIYTVEVIDTNNCSSIDHIDITVHPLPVIDLPEPDNITCKNPVVVLRSYVSEDTKVIWSTGGLNHSTIVTEPGTYSMIATSPFGCISEAKVSVAENTETPSVEITGNEMLNCNTPSIVLAAEVVDDSSEYSFRWSVGSNRRNLQVSQPGEYYVDVTAGNGCTTRAHIHVEQDLDIRDPFIPNAIRPGSSFAENQVFIPVFYCPPYNYRMQVFNRFGNRVFLSTNPSEAWDGKVNGEEGFPGVFVYIINYDDSGGNQIEESGVVKLIR